MRRQPAPAPILAIPEPSSPDPSRQGRNLAGVMAQYIQDLTRGA
jgi:hypothetical protein